MTIDAGIITLAVLCWFTDRAGLAFGLIGGLGLANLVLWALK